MSKKAGVPGQVPPGEEVMTPMERAMALTAQWHQTGGGCLEELIAAAVVEAKAEERARIVSLLRWHRVDATARVNTALGAIADMVEAGQ